MVPYCLGLTSEIALILAPPVGNDGKLLAIIYQIQPPESSISQHYITILNIFIEFIVYVVLLESVLHQRSKRF